MEKTIVVSFPGGKGVDADMDGMKIQTDQAEENGGQGRAPEPFQLFMASIATCAGIYALEFCRAREIPTDDMALTMRYDFDPKKGLCDALQIDLKVPLGFPEKYEKAVLRVMDLCTVKRQMLNPPEFIMRVEKT
ncbi:MAG: OsmC family protein [Deltaproteobacteria bacterium]|jgi:ribosomal protein S12 methylthiotransferase accessory factor